MASSWRSERVCGLERPPTARSISVVITLPFSSRMRRLAVFWPMPGI